MDARPWLLLLACSATGSAFAQSQPVELRVLPRRVYAATDGVAPRWRLMVVAYNRSKGPLTLEQVRQTFRNGNAIGEQGSGGEELSSLTRGHLKVEPEAPLAIYLADDGEGRLPEAVTVAVTFATPSGEKLSQECTIPLSRRSTVYLRLPLRGRWTVANARETQHGVGTSFAVDFVTADDIALHELPPQRTLKLSDFSSYGQSLLAPVAGQVVACRDDRPDCEPTPDKASFAGRTLTDRSELVGNYLVVVTAHGHYVFMAHLKPGSLRVRVGDEVQEGQLVAQVGNSGNSSGPHLHLEVLDGPPDVAQVASTRFTQSGLPLGFRHARLERHKVAATQERVVPLKSDILSRNEP